MVSAESKAAVNQPLDARIFRSLQASCCCKSYEFVDEPHHRQSSFSSGLVMAPSQHVTRCQKVEKPDPSTLNCYSGGEEQ